MSRAHSTGQSAVWTSRPTPAFNANATINISKNLFAAPEHHANLTDATYQQYFLNKGAAFGARG